MKPIGWMTNLWRRQGRRSPLRFFWSDAAGLLSLTLALAAAPSAWAAENSPSAADAKVQKKSAEFSQKAHSEETAQSDKIGLVIVLPPGADLGTSADRYASEIAAMAETAAGLAAGTIEASAFSSPKDAAAEIRRRKNGCAVLGSLGFYTAYRAELGLSPFLSLIREGGAREENYRIIVRKGSFEKLSDLKGRRIAGTPLLEGKEFLNAALFAGSGMTDGDFVLSPSVQPLREIRKMRGGSGADAVAVDETQFLSLKRLAFFSELAVIYQSAPVPSLGMMVKNGPKFQAVSENFRAALKKVCLLEEGKPLCQIFGISGFADADSAAVEAFADRTSR